MAQSIIAHGPATLNGCPAPALLTVGQVQAIYGLHPNTTRQLCASGLIQTTRLGQGGWRRIVASSVVEYLGLGKKEDEDKGPTKLVVGYHRKSSGTKSDLEIGCRELRDHIRSTYGVENPTIYADLASHINFDGRHQFMMMLDRVFSGEIGTIVVLWKDRLSRLPIHSFLNKVCLKFGATITYVNNQHDENADAVHEAMSDLLAFSHTVSCRIYSKRSAEKKRHHLPAEALEIIKKGLSEGKTSRLIHAEITDAGLTCKTKDGTTKPITYHFLHNEITKRNKVVRFGGADNGAAEFFKLFVRPDPTSFIPKEDMYAEYVSWCQQKNIIALSKWNLGRVLGKEGLKTVTISHRHGPDAARTNIAAWDKVNWSA